MEFDWDPTKHERNRHERGIGFDYAARMFAGPTIEAIDRRRYYGAERVSAITAGSESGRSVKSMAVSMC
jgi:uncharacterized DUF497 family protein